MEILDEAFQPKIVLELTKLLFVHSFVDILNSELRCGVYIFFILSILLAAFCYILRMFFFLHLGECKRSEEGQKTEPTGTSPFVVEPKCV